MPRPKGIRNDEQQKLCIASIGYIGKSGFRLNSVSFGKAVCTVLIFVN